VQVHGGTDKSARDGQAFTRLAGCVCVGISILNLPPTTDKQKPFVRATARNKADKYRGVATVFYIVSPAFFL